jgi:hypothetical protein
MIAPALILPLVIEGRATGTRGPATRTGGFRLYGKRLMLTPFAIAIANGVLVFTYVEMLLAVFISSRFSLLAIDGVV